MFLTIKKTFVITSLCLTFFALFGFSVYAESDNLIVGETIEEASDDVLSYFNYSDKYLIELVSANESSYFSGPLFSSYDIELHRSNVLKDIGPLKLTTGFERDRLTTFSATKALTGVGKEGAVVGLHVFHIDKVVVNESVIKNIVSTQDKKVTLGKSGLYNETVYFDYVGVNYVLLIVEDPITYVKSRRLFKVTLKELETRNKLENMTINFFEEKAESPTLEDFVPEIVDFDF